MLLQKTTFLFITLLSLLLPHKISSSFIISNNCPFTIWPGILASAGIPELSTTGFELDSGMSAKISSTIGWSGRMWARTGCKFDKTGSGTCLTGDCGGKLECKGSGATPPASLFEITLGKETSDKDFYDVSLVDGYNLPIVAWPLGIYGPQCNATGCISDINLGCPKELQVMGSNGDVGTESSGNSVVACKSACEAFGSDQYCCSGLYANPNTCKPSMGTKPQVSSPPPPPTYSNPPPPTYSNPPPPPAEVQTPPLEYQRSNGVSITSSSIVLSVTLLILWLRIFSLLGF
ncbi:hypothetical protein V2J09_001719 [Rumex salicifolius]